MSMRKVFSILALLMFVVQGICYYGMSKSWLGLYPTTLDVGLYATHVEETPLNAKKALFAFTAGFERLGQSFDDLSNDEDPYSSVSYRPATANQMASAIIRESLSRRSGVSFGLFIYDALLTASFLTPAWIGVALYIFSLRSKD